MPTSRKPAPATETGSHNTTNGYAHSSGDYRHQAPTADERRETQLLEELRALGYRVSVNCIACGHPLVAGSSVARHLGPKCAAKAVADNG